MAKAQAHETITDRHIVFFQFSARMDAVVQTPGHVYILEFKADESADAALAQIAERGYADKYRHTGKAIVPVGVNFDTKGRCVGEWKVGA